MTVKELADKLAYNRTTLYRWIRGESEPPPGFPTPIARGHGRRTMYKFDSLEVEAFMTAQLEDRCLQVAPLQVVK